MKKSITKLFCIIALLFASASPGQSGDNELYLYIWSEYIPDEVITDFTRQTGIKLHVSTYDSNEAMYAKIKMIGKGYDLIVPSSDYVGLMRREGLLRKIDTARLVNFANLDPQFTDQSFDPENQYSIPYMWGSTSIAVNTDLLGRSGITSMRDLWKPELKRKLLLPNDPREVFGIALKLLGYTINETDPKKIEQAYEKLTELIPSVLVFDSDSPKQALLAGEVAAGVVWNGEAYIANNEQKAITYLYPPEGFSLWVDSFCIPKGAKNIDAAHVFLDYILQPEVAAKISTEMGYSSPNKEALAYIPDAVKENPIVYPPPEDAARGEFLDNLGDEVMSIYNNYWLKLKTR